MHLYSIKDRVAIVTGASSGNGRAIALALASQGARLVCSDLDPAVKSGGYEKSQTPTHELIAQNGQAVFKKADVSAGADVRSLVELAVETYGRVDMYVS